MKVPVADIQVFDRIVQSLIQRNPLGCTPYFARVHHHPPIEKLREMYTAKFEYRNERRKRVGSTIEVYDSVEGYDTGIAAVISNMANIASHRAKPRHLPKADLYSVMLQCHDREGELYFLNISRTRITLSSFMNDAIQKKVEAWTDSVPELA
ncbi:MAG TPA: hypothetical protein VEI81_00415 [Methanoregula sp.]|nr:hypothetical protein [Methanoregula sp.]